MRGIVVIDDAGTPGAVPESESLHADRKSWAAVLVHPRIEEQVRQAMCIFTDGVGNDFGVNELHFPEIYGGRGAYKDVSIEKRYELFGLMSELFRSFRLPIFFQTMSSAFLAELHTRLGGLPQRAGWFSLQKVEHVGLLLRMRSASSWLISPPSR